ncbi:septum site-determining protein MinC [Helicobacter cappadocius]|uniref:Septum site-determining protein MinC n=1 Tax=Helicobacter cappadocius TaxID=3063998 RepID=A0AA90SST0_9HELI|nr:MULTISPECIES: septum site-determining protein MinC [unclassified Helicobacter]MDO7253301.1 septum site-determining protein MinC [Helicobacter sp. faydin-H75]MDP2539269.1 septum site-determining protein MinC [Helicobacter sp. faydin-H76]
MIKTRQKNIKIFEFSGGETQEYIDFITKNFILLKDYLFVFKHKIEAGLESFLNEMKITYVVNETDFKGRDVEVLKVSNIKTQAKIYQKNIRSGEELDSSGDLIFLGNINNGAKITTEGSITIFGKCDGVIVCLGEYIILRNVNSGHIVFQGEILSLKMIERINSNDFLKIITKDGDNILIKEIK